MCADPRVRSWPLLDDPTPVALLCGTWLVFVLGVGPRVMRHRQPLKLAGLIQVINVLQILANSYVTYEVSHPGTRNYHPFV